MNHAIGERLVGNASDDRRSPPRVLMGRGHDSDKRGQRVPMGPLGAWETVEEPGRQTGSIPDGHHLIDRRVGVIGSRPSKVPTSSKNPEISSTGSARQSVSS
jgi:hypothetical protein